MFVVLLHQKLLHVFYMLLINVKSAIQNNSEIYVSQKRIIKGIKVVFKYNKFLLKDFVSKLWTQIFFDCTFSTYFMNKTNVALIPITCLHMRLSSDVICNSEIRKS